METNNALLGEPVSLLVRRRPRRDEAGAFEKLLQETINVASTFQGHLGVDVIRPSGNDDTYRILVRFSSEQELDAWLGAPEADEWLGKLDALQEPPTQFQRLTGLERWFVDGKDKAPAFVPPARYKIATLTMIGAYPTVMLMFTFLQPIIGHLPAPLRSALFVPLMTLTLTYLVMPWLSKRCATWLYARSTT